MMVANAPQGSAGGLASALSVAQDAIHLPEVQEMLRRLAVFKLGIYMPHMHDAETGAFQPLSDQVTQVESGLEVTFRSADDIANQADRFLTVGWTWRAGASAPSAVCEMIRDDKPGGTERTEKHKMSGETQRARIAP